MSLLFLWEEKWYLTNFLLFIYIVLVFVLIISLSATIFTFRSSSISSLHWNMRSTVWSQSTNSFGCIFLRNLKCLSGIIDSKLCHCEWLLLVYEESLLEPPSSNLICCTSKRACWAVTVYCSCWICRLISFIFISCRILSFCFRGGILITVVQQTIWWRSRLCVAVFVGGEKLLTMDFLRFLYKMILFSRTKWVQNEKFLDVLHCFMSFSIILYHLSFPFYWASL